MRPISRSRGQPHSLGQVSQRFCSRAVSILARRRFRASLLYCQPSEPQRSSPGAPADARGGMRRAAVFRCGHSASWAIGHTASTSGTGPFSSSRESTWAILSPSARIFCFLWVHSSHSKALEPGLARAMAGSHSHRTARRIAALAGLQQSFGCGGSHLHATCLVAKPTFGRISASDSPKPANQHGQPDGVDRVGQGGAGEPPAAIATHTFSGRSVELGGRTARRMCVAGRAGQQSNLSFRRDLEP
jgi:hypothetical protein